MSTGATPTPQELRARATALAAEAKTLRRELFEQSYEGRLSEIAIERDRAARAQYAAEQEAKSADLQVQREEKKAADADKQASEAEARAESLARTGKSSEAEEEREYAQMLRSGADIAEARARQAQLDAAALREDAAKHAREVVELETAGRDHNAKVEEAMRELDEMEDQARLFDDAAMKMIEAEMLKEAPPPASMAEVDKRTIEISSLEVAADEALEKASAIDIDRQKLAAVLPQVTAEADPLPSPDVGTADDLVPGAVANADADADVIAEGDGELDTDWLQEFLEEPAPTPDLSDDFADVTVTDSGFEMEPADVAFADAIALGADELPDEGAMDDFA